MKKATQIGLTGCALVFSLALSGCGGGGAQIESTSVSHGQQLLDLKEAYDKGAITIDEYEDAKEEILDDLD